MIHNIVSKNKYCNVCCIVLYMINVSSSKTYSRHIMVRDIKRHTGLYRDRHTRLYPLERTEPKHCVHPCPEIYLLFINSANVQATLSDSFIHKLFIKFNSNTQQSTLFPKYFENLEKVSSNNTPNKSKLF